MHHPNPSAVEHLHQSFSCFLYTHIFSYISLLLLHTQVCKTLVSWGGGWHLVSTGETGLYHFSCNFENLEDQIFIAFFLHLISSLLHMVLSLFLLVMSLLLYSLWKIQSFYSYIKFDTSVESTGRVCSSSQCIQTLIHYFSREECGLFLLSRTSHHHLFNFMT